MHGNVWEWTSAPWTNSYAGIEFSTGSGAHDGSGNRVQRGGSYFNPARSCRSAHRHRQPPGHRDKSVGFRVSLQTK